MEVQDVEVLVAEGGDGAEGARGVGGERRHRAVGRGGDAVAEGDDADLGGRAVARAENQHVVALAPQGMGEAEHLALDAAGNGEAVGADEPDAHESYPLGRRPARSTHTKRGRHGTERTGAGNTGQMNEDNLTRAEAQERASMLSELSYDVDVDLTGEGDTYASTTVIRFSAEPGAATFVDLDAAAVRELTLNGEAVPLDAFDADRSRITLPAVAARNELRVVADCSVPAHRRRPAPLRRPDRREPVPPHPVRALRRPPGVRLLRPARPQGHVRPGGDRSRGLDRRQQQPCCEARGAGRWRFETTPVISTYLVAIVAGPYHVVEERHGGVGMAIYCRESLAQYLDADEIFTVTRQGLDFFEAEFGYPYPFEKYDQLFVPEFNFGAMENPGCITFNEGYIFRSRVTDAAFENRAGTILHEMAHMWFGDLVTMHWWDDLWLNESFATYMGNDAVARATRFSDVWVRFAAGTKGWALVQDQLPTTHPISADIVDTDAVRLHFDGITYAKGASVLKQLVAWVGKDAFTEGVRRYFRRHEWANASLADFLGRAGGDQRPRSVGLGRGVAADGRREHHPGLVHPDDGVPTRRSPWSRRASRCGRTGWRSASTTSATTASPAGAGWSSTWWAPRPTSPTSSASGPPTSCWSTTTTWRTPRSASTSAPSTPSRPT